MFTCGKKSLKNTTNTEETSSLKRAVVHVSEKRRKKALLTLHYLLSTAFPSLVSLPAPSQASLGPGLCGGGRLWCNESMDTVNTGLEIVLGDLTNRRQHPSAASLRSISSEAVPRNRKEILSCTIPSYRPTHTHTCTLVFLFLLYRRT